MSQETKSPKCARTACDSPGLLPHRDTGKLYCPKCARRINEGCSEKFFTFPSETKSPGMRALERYENVSKPYCNGAGMMEPASDGAWVSYEQACQELENENKKLSELRQQADALAKALESYLSATGTLGAYIQPSNADCRAALAAYRKETP